MGRSLRKRRFKDEEETMAWTSGNAPKSAMGLAASCAAAILAGYPAKAENCPTSASTPFQHIKIFNDTAQWLFPVLDTGQNPDGDIWLQAIFGVPNSKTPQGGGNCAYGEKLEPLAKFN
jgi:hypothetical protein